MKRAGVLFVIMMLLPVLPLAQTRQSVPSPAASDTGKPTPRTASDGNFLEFDFPSLHIGTAEYEEGGRGVSSSRCD